MSGLLRPDAAMAAGLVGVLAAVTVATSAAASDARARMCRPVPGPVLALVRVERDTTLPAGTAVGRVMSASSVRAGPGDSLLAVDGTPMPAARVRLLRLDAATRATLAAAGVGGREPVAFLQAAPFRADCRTVRWTGPVPFAVPGDTGFVRAILAPRAHWVGTTPVLVVREVWRYPYPGRRGLVVGDATAEPLASPGALFDLSTALAAAEPPTPADPAATGPRGDWTDVAAAQRTVALAWARANVAEREREPVRAIVREATLDPDFEDVAHDPSRLRGTYRVTVEARDAREVWYFRTEERPGAPWRGRDAVHTTADLLAAPYTAGYQLTGYAAPRADALPGLGVPVPHAMFGGPRVPRVWLSTEDRPTLPGNAARHVLPGMLEFPLAAAPETLWPALESLVPPTSAADSAFFAGVRFTLERSQRQPRVPLTVHVEAGGAVRADTTMRAGGRLVRVRLERLDTLSVRRPF